MLQRCLIPAIQVAIFSLVTVPVSAITGCLSADNQRFEDFDDTHQLCCNGTHPKYSKNGQEQKCCSVILHDSETTKLQVYNADTSLCCGGVLYDLRPHHIHARPKCCGDQVLLNRTTEFCCGDKLYKKSNIHYDCFQEGDISFTITIGEKVCTKLTDNGTEFEVYTAAQVSRNGPDCCGLILYYERNNICFNDELWPADSIPAECGPAHKSYDKARKVCCQDTGELISIPEAHAKYLNILPNYHCSNGQLIDADKFQIIGSQVIPRNFLPCGPNEYYDPKITRGKVGCCNGTLNYAGLGMDVKCCGNELIDTHEHNCCNGRKLPKSKGCCGNTSYDIYRTDVECCGLQLINDSYLCCRPQSSLYIPTLKHKSNDNTCCGRTTFHPLEGECCGGKVYKHFSPNQVCNVYGEVVNVSKKQVKLKDIINRVNTSTAAGSQKPEVRLRNLPIDCPACLPYKQQFQGCTKKFKYQVYVRKTETKHHSTSIHVLLLEPDIMRKTRMTLTTRGKCTCFKQDAVYNLYTNRNLKVKIKNGKTYQSKFTRRDLLFEVMGNFGNFHRGHKCKIERYLKKKPTVS